MTAGSVDVGRDGREPEAEGLWTAEATDVRTLTQDKLARQETELRASGTSARASAKKSPSADPFKSGALDRDFESQLAAVASAEANFAPAPAASVAQAGPGGSGGGFAQSPPRTKPQDTHEGKAQVRSNQDTASQLGF